MWTVLIFEKKEEFLRRLFSFLQRVQMSNELNLKGQLCAWLDVSSSRDWSGFELWLRVLQRECAGR